MTRKSHILQISRDGNIPACIRERQDEILAYMEGGHRPPLAVLRYVAFQA